MSLADALAAPAATTGRCPVADLLDTLPERDAAALRAALEPDGRDGGYIHAILTAENIRITRMAVERHKTRVALLRGHVRKQLPCGCTDL